MLEKIIEIICEFVDCEPDAITAESSLRNDVGATSFDLMNIAVEIEKRFKIRISDSKITTIKTVGDIAERVEALKAE